MVEESLAGINALLVPATSRVPLSKKQRQHIKGTLLGAFPAKFDRDDDIVLKATVKLLQTSSALSFACRAHVYKPEDVKLLREVAEDTVRDMYALLQYALVKNYGPRNAVDIAVGC